MALEWLRRIFGRQTTPEKPTGSSRVPWMAKTPSGVFIDEDRAQTFSAVWACVRIISTGVAALPWTVRREITDGSERLSTHPADRLLNRRPNPETTAFNFRNCLIRHALLWGNGYAEIERDGAMRPVAMYPIAPDRVVPDRDQDGRLIYRVYQANSAQIIIQARDMFHLPGETFDGLSGMSVIRYAARGLGLGIAAEEFGSRFFGNGAHPSGVLQHPGSLSEPAFDHLRKSIEEHQSGVNAQKTMILEDGMTWQSLTIPPEDAQFLETRKFQVEDICRWFGVPPHKVGALDKATFNNIEHQATEFVVDTLTPWIKRLEEEADAKLLSPTSSSLFTHITVEGLLRGDTKSRGEFYQKLFNMAVLSPNDIRRLEDMNSIGPEGDKRLVQVNMTTLDKVGDGDASGANPDVAPPMPLPENRDAMHLMSD